MMTERKLIEIADCPECRGVWFDRGELDRFIQHAERQIGADSRSDFPDRTGGHEQRNLRMLTQGWKQYQLREPA